MNQIEFSCWRVWQGKHTDIFAFRIDRQPMGIGAAVSEAHKPIWMFYVSASQASQVANCLRDWQAIR